MPGRTRRSRAARQEIGHTGGLGEVQGERFQIGNNRGGINGWITDA